MKGACPGPSQILQSRNCGILTSGGRAIPLQTQPKMQHNRYLCLCLATPCCCVCGPSWHLLYCLKAVCGGLGWPLLALMLPMLMSATLTSPRYTLPHPKLSSPPPITFPHTPVHLTPPLHTTHCRQDGQRSCWKMRTGEARAGLTLTLLFKLFKQQLKP